MPAGLFSGRHIFWYARIILCRRDRSVNILFVMDEYHAENNGLCISAQRFASEFKGMGHEVRILACGKDGYVDYPLSELKIPVFDSLIKKQGYRFAKVDLLMIHKAVKWADVLYIESPFIVSSEAARMAHRMKKPCTGAFHLYPENITSSLHMQRITPLNRHIAEMFHRMVYRYCSDIQCPSWKVRESLIKYGYREKLHVISNGIPAEAFLQDRKEKPEIFRDKFVIVCIGRFSVEKRQDVLIRAMHYSADPDRIQLIFAGQGPLLDRYRKISSDLSNEPVFRFMSQSDLRSVMSYADLFVHCADTEIEGMSCLEAMAAGNVPVIAYSDKSSSGQFALDKRSLFRAGNSRQLAGRIDYWINNPQELEEMRDIYRENSRKYAISNSADALIKMFMGAVSGMQKRKK